MSHLSPTHIVCLVGLIAPCILLIGCWATVDMVRLVKAARDGRAL